MTSPAYRSFGRVRNIHFHAPHLEIQCPQGRVRITAVSDSVMRVRATQANELGADFSYAMADSAATAGGPATEVTHRSARGSHRLATKACVARVDLSPLRISFERPDGLMLNRDDRQRGMGWEGPASRVHRELAPGEMFFGCGERSGQLNKRGEVLRNWNTDKPGHTYMDDALYASIPFLISARRENGQVVWYGILFDNAHASRFNLGQVEDERHYWLAAEAGEIDYYFFAGPTLPAIIRDYTQLTGRMWMPPRWALGYHQCRWGYRSAEEILEVAGQLRRRRIPCDAIYCDIDYMDGYRVWTWDPKRFPRPRAMSRQLARQGMRLVTIIDPGVKNDDGYGICREGKEQGMFVRKPDGNWFTGTVWPGECVFPDFTSPRVREWWGDCHRRHLAAGVDGFWNDMNEPAVWNGINNTMPLETPHEYEGHWATHARAHNVYGMNMARACHEGLRRLRPHQRPFVITRAAYAGVQRYAMMWMGDNESRWEQLALSIPQLLNMSLSGVTFCGVDIGGFGGNTTGELLARWMQAGALYPFCRNHSAWGTRAQEPWAFGRRIEQICRAAIELRYRLLPYLYNQFHQSVTDGTPIMQPLFWEFPDDPHAFAVDDQYLVGPALLVAPVLKPATAQRTVYLPGGVDWYDFHTGARHAGGQFITVAAPLDVLPLYVRAGSILPLADVVQHVGQRGSGRLTLQVYPGPSASGQLYEDDGNSFGYERGRYRLTEFRWANGKLTKRVVHAGCATMFRRTAVVVAGRARGA